MTTQPLLATDELIQDICGFIKGLKQISKFERMKLVSKAKSLRGKIADCDVYDFFGMIFCLENDVKLAIEHHENAIKKAPENFMVQHNYFKSLNALGLFSEARELCKSMLVNFSNKDVKTVIISFMIGSLLSSGRLQEAHIFLDKLEEPSKYPDYKVITEGLSIFKEVGLGDDEAEKISNCIFDFLRDKKIYLAEVHVNIVDDCLLYQIYVDLPIEKIFDVNWEAAGVLAESVEDMRSDVIMFEFNSVDILLEGCEE